MKPYLLGFFSALVLVALVYFARGFFGGFRPVAPENLKTGVKDHGSLRVEIYGKGKPLSDVEVDLGTIGNGGPTGPMSFTVTDANGVALFEKVPVGGYDVFFNMNHFPSDYIPPLRVPVEILKDGVAQKRIDLSPK